MDRKRIVNLVPLLAVMAFAVVPAAAQAAPHWYKKNKPLTPSPVTTTSSGKLTFNMLSATITCKVNNAEELWNPTGGPGEDLVTGFVLSNCKTTVGSAACPKGKTEIKAEGLGWPSRLFSPSATEIRDEIVKIRLNVGCAGTSGTVGDVFEGALAPQVVKNALMFGGPGGGTLTDLAANVLTVTGADKLKALPGKIKAKDP